MSLFNILFIAISVISVVITVGYVVYRYSYKQKFKYTKSSENEGNPYKGSLKPWTEWEGKNNKGKLLLSQTKNDEFCTQYPHNIGCSAQLKLHRKHLRTPKIN